MKLSLKKITSKTSGNARTKPGSVLIMVVGLLVLLALIGTAFLSSSHAERSVSIQATTDARVDLLVQGVEQMAKATIASGGINPNPDPNTGSYATGSVPATVLGTTPNAFQLRPKFDEPEFSAPNNSVPMGYGEWDMPDMQSQLTNKVNVFGLAATAAGAETQRFFVPVDSWLSPRFPQPVPYNPTYTPYNTTVGTPPSNATFTNSATGTTYPLPTWLSIGKPLIGDHFESPFVGTISSSGVETLNSTALGVPLPLEYQERLDPWVNYAAQNEASFLGARSTAPPAPTSAGEFVPRYIQVPPNSGNWFPAWALQTPVNVGGVAMGNSGQGTTPYYYLAGDADGDGVADCGMFRLPSNLDGLTWYAGVRIIDNGSAVNVNTAWDRDSDYDGTSTTYLLPTTPTTPIPLASGTGYTTTGANAYNYGQVLFTISQGMFTANVGLQELLHTWIPANQPVNSTASGNSVSANQVAGDASVGEMTYLNGFRFNCQSLQHYTNPTSPELSVAPLGSLTLQEPQGVFFYSNATGAISTSYPFDEYYDAPTQNSGSNVPASTQQRTDFWYLTMGDALQSVLGRRLNNPGNLSAGNDNFPGAVALQAQPYGLEDSAALAYHFCLINPATITPGLATNTWGTAGTGTISPYAMPGGTFYSGGNTVAATSWGYGITGSKIERDLYRSVFDTAPNSPFPPSFNNPEANWVGFMNLRNSGHSQYSPSLFTEAADQGGETVYSWYRDNFDFVGEGTNTGADPSSAGAPSATNQYMYLAEPAPTNLGKGGATLPTNFKPRRSMLVATNAVSNLMPWVDPPDYNSVSSGIPTAGTLNSAAFGTLGASVVMGYGNSGATAYTINSTPNLVPKANPNTSSFGDLWRAYWGVMAMDHAVAGGGTFSQSPYGGGTYVINIATQSLYLGRQFTQPPAVFASPYISQQPLTFLPNSSQANQATVVKQAMFSSPIRDNHMLSLVTGGEPGADLLDPDQVMTLRSALAAQNTLIMRDPLHGCFGTPGVGTFLSSQSYFFNGNLRRVVHLGKTPANGSGYDAIIYGAMQNPYIAEVYINTDNQSNGGPPPTYPSAPNPDGYVAIKLFNPYPFNIPLNGWALAVVDRVPNTGPLSAQYPRAHIIYTFGAGAMPIPAYPPSITYGWPTGTSANAIVPANPSPNSRSAGGYLVLENYDPNSPGADNDAHYRPNAMAQNATVSTTPPAYQATPPTQAPLMQIDIPNLAAALFNPSVFPAQICTKELVLLRPVMIDGSAQSEYVPVDSFDFTGVPTPPAPPTDGSTYTANAAGLATGWHYARPNAPGGYPVNQPASPISDTQTPSVWAGIPAPAAFGVPAPNFLSGNLWRFIYPGRYDGSVSPYVGATTTPVAGGMPRQQGVHTEYWNPTTTPPPNEPWDPALGAGDTPPVAILGSFTNSNPANFYGSYPTAFPFRYLDDSLPGPNPVQALSSAGGSFSNLAPFGAFARDADIAEVPFVGAYSLVREGSVPVVSPALPMSFIANVLDYNTLSSDLAMAEDTDVSDDPMPDYAQSAAGSGAGSQSAARNSQDILGEWSLWHEEIGRFCPVMNTGDGVGTFVTNNTASLGTIYAVDDGNLLAGYHTNSAAAATPVYWRYHWATRLFDFLSTQTPHNDFLPNVDQTAYNNPHSVVSTSVQPLSPTPVSNSGLPALAYQAPTVALGGVPVITVGTITSSVYGAGNSVGTNTEAGVGVEGRININTANWRVLSTLPWVPPGMPRDQFAMSSTAVTSNGITIAPPYQDYIDDNVKLAQIICDYRDGTNYTGLNNAPLNGLLTGPIQLGPFRSIYDLYKIPPLYQYYVYMLATHEPSPNFGDQMGPTLNYCDPYSSNDGSTLEAPSINYTTPQAASGCFTGVPVNYGFAGVRLDFEERANMLGRLSNLITTRSDSFTVYIVVQGWKNAGSTNPLEPPQLVVQRRSAFIADRSGITAPGGQVKTYNFPND